jgi:hypothetical protein
MAPVCRCYEPSIAQKIEVFRPFRFVAQPMHIPGRSPFHEIRRFAPLVIVPCHLRKVTLSTGSSSIVLLAMAGRHNGEITR